MIVKQIGKRIEDISIGEVFQHEGQIWIKTNSSHKEAGYECVDLRRGNIAYIDNGTKVTDVKAELRVFTAVPSKD